MKNDIWEAILYFYKKHFNIPKHVIEYIAIESVLDMCVQGYSNKRIARKLDIDRRDAKYITDILENYLSFSGWVEDLDFSPIAVYNNNKGELLKFREDCLVISYVTDIFFIDTAYYICSEYQRVTEILKEEIEKYVR